MLLRGLCGIGMTGCLKPAPVFLNDPTGNQGAERPNPITNPIDIPQREKGVSPGDKSRRAGLSANEKREARRRRYLNADVMGALVPYILLRSIWY